jgi:hypothetical protein
MADGIFNSITLTRQAEYKRTYDRLMERARGRVKEKGVHENHHIIPRSMGGSNEKSNIVALTYKEHFLAHWLLAKFTMGRDQIKMLNALYYISKAGPDHKNRRLAGWQIERSRRANAEATVFRNKAPEASESYRKSGESRRARDATPEGKLARKRAGWAIRARDATPEGKLARKRAGLKTGATRKARGSALGENNPKAKVTETIVRCIREHKGMTNEIARYFGVSYNTVYGIRTRRTWKHVV